MNKILTKEVSYELAKLLKEKGFPLKFEVGSMVIRQDVNTFRTDGAKWSERNPTIAEVLDWIFEKYDIWIEVSLNQFSKPKDLQWMYSITFTQDCTYSHSPKSFNLQIEAYEEAIKYVLCQI